MVLGRLSRLGEKWVYGGDRCVPVKGGETKVKGSFVIHQDGPMSWWGLAAAQPACSPHRRAEGPGVEWRITKSLLTVAILGVSLLGWLGAFCEASPGRATHPPWEVP